MPVIGILSKCNINWLFGFLCVRSEGCDILFNITDYSCKQGINPELYFWNNKIVGLRWFQRERENFNVKRRKYTPETYAT